MSKTDEFLERLVQETLNDLRSWHPVSSTLIEKNPLLGTVLCEDEWHRIRFNRSYYLPFKSGYFYLIDKWTESGRDGTEFDGLVLYIQADIKHAPYEVARDLPPLYRLLNVISEKNALPQEVEGFINSFLES